ncbi:MG2 domain protein [Marine Group I thaumarchaeote SCGC AAA799-E16]|uniref:MG2 domain protein n=4 Tax=Marine Group I TaxID=905826 RepID=A0A087S8J8_9ARCH|nr:MG2 domain protein [Marine Group I thaumarchaeote SCGC AAA799-E16]KFM17201.1 MG2 domain protein [Marine Group I thaumarchaeote SCGC AAA799-D11]KFM19058.1 MG2 domain protein [Marine Group I thaumarchaeote SCGC RSA3]KFM22052.1 MG2 domain protein [Marine Group I thaumarchaeote SCGC AAA799-B03]
MKSQLMVFALSAILVASIGMAPAFGQIQNTIVVTTDKTAYSEGEIIMVTGEVRDLYSGTPVSLIVKAPNGNMVSIAQLTVGADKKFSTEITAGGSLMRAEGTYTITVQYGNDNRSATTSFEFGGSTVEKPTDSMTSEVTDTTVSIEGSTDLIGYEITGAKLLGIMPDVDANSLIISIDAMDDGSITLTIPRSVLDATFPDGADDDFFVLVDGEEVDFDETKSSTDRTLTITFPAGAEEIEIIGTFVVPEFGTIAAMILAVAIISIIAVSAKSRLSIMPRI